MVIRQAEIWWVDLPEPKGSEPGYRRPVLIVQGDGLNFSQIATQGASQRASLRKS